MLPSHMMHQQQAQQQAQQQQQQQHQMMMQQQQQQMMQQQQQMGGQQGPPLLAQQVPPPPGSLPQQQSIVPPQHMQQQQQALAEINPFHPINRLKHLLPELKQALATLLRIAADCIKTDSPDSTAEMTAPETSAIVLQNAFDMFSSICDQMEQCFFLLQDADRQAGYSNYFLPVNVSVGADKDENQNQPPAGPKMTMNFAQFHSVVKRQIDCARAVHDRLIEMVRELQQREA